MDFRRSENIMKSLDNYYNLMQETTDTADYVPEKYNKKIFKYLFKEFKLTFKQAKKEYAKVASSERKTERQAKFKAFFEKIKIKFKKKQTVATGITPELLAQLTNLTKQTQEQPQK